MNNCINRRSFLTTTLAGIGTVALAGPVEFLSETKGIDDMNAVRRPADKILLATTDFMDNVIINARGSRYDAPVARAAAYYDHHECFMNHSQLDELHRFLASLGVRRHQWIVDTIWNLYDNYPHGFDLLAEAAGSAHKHGMEFYAEIKPFEGGGFGIVLPHSMPFPDGAVAFRDLRGIYPIARPFAAHHLPMNLKRREGNFECDGPVTSIRLVKIDDRPTRLKAGHLSVWTSSANNGFKPYSGPIHFSETVEARYKFPGWRPCRILHLDGLEIPQGHKYFLVRCALADTNGDFMNEKGYLIELAGPDGKVFPVTLSTGPVSLETHQAGFYQSKVHQTVVRYLQMPEVRAEINDCEKMEGHYLNYYGFGEYNLADQYTLDKEGYIAAACGKPEYMFGNLHPVYPEVREHWLELVRYCLDRGVDGVNFRAANHVLSPEPWEYGFNDPALRITSGNRDFAALSRVNGDAYTLFLQEARELIKKRGKKMTIHLNSAMLIPDERPGKVTALPDNFEWQWEAWVKEIADDLEFRGIFKLRPWSLEKVLSIFSAATRAAGKPFYLQGDFHGLAFNGPFRGTEAEVDLVNNHSGLDGYVYYETANITRLNDAGKLEGSPGIIEVLDKLSTGADQKGDK